MPKEIAVPSENAITTSLGFVISYVEEISKTTQPEECLSSIFLVFNDDFEESKENHIFISRV